MHYFFIKILQIKGTNMLGNKDHICTCMAVLLVILNFAWLHIGIQFAVILLFSMDCDENRYYRFSCEKNIRLLDEWTERILQKTFIITYFIEWLETAMTGKGTAWKEPALPSVWKGSILKTKLIWQRKKPEYYTNYNRYRQERLMHKGRNECHWSNY